MTLFAFAGALESGLLYAVLALAVYLSFRIMKIPDLTVDGSFTTGAAIAATMTAAGHPLLAVPVMLLAGGAAGAVTALLHTRLRITPVLSGILTMTALYSVNLLIMNNQASLMLPNSTKTVFSVFAPLRSSFLFGRVIPPLLLAGLLVGGLILFFRSRSGLAVRATGDNETMVRSSSINAEVMKVLALSVSNALAALCGGLIAVRQYYCDIKMGSGAIILGLASLILGEVLVRGKASVLRGLLAAVVGAVVYQLVIAQSLAMNLNSSLLKLVSVIIVLAAIAVPRAKEAASTQLYRRRQRNFHTKEVPEQC